VRGAPSVDFTGVNSYYEQRISTSRESRPALIRDGRTSSRSSAPTVIGKATALRAIRAAHCSSRRQRRKREASNAAGRITRQRIAARTWAAWPIAGAIAARRPPPGSA
jgi:hypothetical protein